MVKPPVYTPREQAVLESPDYYIIRVFTNGQWVDSIPFGAAEALKRYNNIRNGKVHYRMILNAVRIINDEQHLAAITPAYLNSKAENASS